jgi:hypothetical protein
MTPSYLRAPLYPIVCALVGAFAADANAGTPAAPPPSKPAEQSLLSFADGRIVFDIQERVRWEIRENNFDFNDSIRSLTDDNWVQHRLRIGLTLKPTNWITIYAQAQDAREWLSDRPDIPNQFGAEGDDTFDLRQGYIELANPGESPWSLRMGRQLLAYGSQRLIGTGDWANFSRSFDAVKVVYKRETWSLDAFASTVVNVDRGEYNQSDFFNGTETSRNQVFSGLYFSTASFGPQTTDVYALHLHEEQVFTETNFLTLGFRILSKPGAFAPSEEAPSDGKSVADGKTVAPTVKKPIGLDYELEANFQTGEVRDLDLTAFAVHAGIGYTFDHPFLPRIALDYSFASGDGDPLDGEVETFQNLFPSNHPPYGLMDVFAWQNIHDAAVIATFNPVKSVAVRAEYHAFWLADTSDGWYRSPTAIVRPLTPAARSASNYAGSELDFVVSWKVRKEFTVEAGYCHFFAGDYLDDTGAGDDADFGYVQATLTF